MPYGTQLHVFSKFLFKIVSCLNSTWRNFDCIIFKHFPSCCFLSPRNSDQPFLQYSDSSSLPKEKVDSKVNHYNRLKNCFTVAKYNWFLLVQFSPYSMRISYLISADWMITRLKSQPGAADAGTLAYLNENSQNFQSLGKLHTP